MHWYEGSSNTEMNKRTTKIERTLIFDYIASFFLQLSNYLKLSMNEVLAEVNESLQRHHSVEQMKTRQEFCDIYFVVPCVSCQRVISNEKKCFTLLTWVVQVTLYRANILSWSRPVLASQLLFLNGSSLPMTTYPNNHSRKDTC